MTGYAARYSTDINADFERGYSFRGWAVTAQPTKEKLVKEMADVAMLDWELTELEDAGEAFSRAGIEIVETAGGWLPINPGLCAFFADDEDDAIELARADTRFTDMPLYVFPAIFVCKDIEDSDNYAGAAIVKPIAAHVLL